jgi:hypothetical protein
MRIIRSFFHLLRIVRRIIMIVGIIGLVCAIAYGLTMGKSAFKMNSFDSFPEVPNKPAEQPA